LIVHDRQGRSTMRFEILKVVVAEFHPDLSQNTHGHSVRGLQLPLAPSNRAMGKTSAFSSDIVTLPIV
jgi:hypothetical protein